MYIGRIRPEYDYENDTFNKTNWSFFISGDQLLKGAAYNSVQILDEIIKLNSIQKLSNTNIFNFP